MTKITIQAETKILPNVIYHGQTKETNTFVIFSISIDNLEHKVHLVELHENMLITRQLIYYKEIECINEINKRICNITKTNNIILS